MKSKQIVSIIHASYLLLLEQKIHIYISLLLFPESWTFCYRCQTYSRLLPWHFYQHNQPFGSTPPPGWIHADISPFSLVRLFARRQDIVLILVETNRLFSRSSPFANIIFFPNFASVAFEPVLDYARDNVFLLFTFLDACSVYHQFRLIRQIS